MSNSNPNLSDLLSQAFSTELPDLDSMGEYLNYILPKIRPLSEDLSEEAHYTDRPWLEFQDNDHFHNIILHFFNPGGEYLRSVNGDVEIGNWRYLESSNKLLLQNARDTQLYDLAYMDKNFFILTKHGELDRNGFPRYFVLAHESFSKNLEWREIMVLLYDSYRNNNRFYFVLTMIVLVILAAIMVFSLR